MKGRVDWAGHREGLCQDSGALDMDFMEGSISFCTESGKLAQTHHPLSYPWRRWGRSWGLGSGVEKENLACLVCPQTRVSEGIWGLTSSGGL